MLEIDFSFPDWRSKVKRSEAKLMLFVVAQIQTNRGMLFDAEGAYNGHPKWAPLGLRNGQALSNRGNLRKSIAPSNGRGLPGNGGTVRFSGDTIVVGTTLLYARMMNDGTTKMPGGVLRAKNAKALKIPLPSGENATQKTRTIKASHTLDQIDKLAQGMSKARQRALRARVRFTKSGSDKHLKATIAAERAVVNRNEKLDHLNAKAERIRLTGKGGAGFMFRKSVKIPARNFTAWNEQDQAEVDGAFLAKLAGTLNG